MEESSKKILIAGAGPAGLTAAIYLSRAGFDTTVFSAEEYCSSSLYEASMVENFPGFPEGISGAELVTRMQEQAVLNGAIVSPLKIVKIDSDGKNAVDDCGNSHHYDAIVVAVGRIPLKLSFPGDDRIFQHTCAVCDGMAFKSKDVIVIGGGDTAFSEALYLSRICNKVTMVIRRDVPRVSNKVVFNEALSTGNIEILWNSEIKSVEFPSPEFKLARFSVKEKDGGIKEATREFHGLFSCVGFKRNTIEIVGNGNVHFCGDCDADETQFQAVIAAGTGARTALKIIDGDL